VVSFAPRPLYPRGKSPSTHWIGGRVNPRAGLDDVENRKILTPPGLELRSLGHPVSRQSPHRLRYPSSLLFNSFPYLFLFFSLLPFVSSSFLIPFLCYFFPTFSVFPFIYSSFLWFLSLLLFFTSVSFFTFLSLLCSYL
jgi:hypothetical protein